MSTPAAIPTKFSSSGPVVAHHFEDWEQQYDSCVLGMWTFLVSEVMFFGGAFTTYMVYRWSYPEAFAHASQHLDIYWGTFNTFVLLTSSLTMALAVRAAHLSQSRTAGLFIIATILLGAAFLGIKFYEYYHKYEEGLMPVFGMPFNFEGPSEQRGPTQLFYGLYFAMTGIHAVHMIIGIVIMLLFIPPAFRGAYSSGNSLRVEIMGLYWHFVDLVWIFLFPLLYLIDRAT
ncbi:MAG TPA: cytochrome c oxidase subunit 3 family protein [Lacipirellula sp.]